MKGSLLRGCVRTQELPSGSLTALPGRTLKLINSSKDPKLDPKLESEQLPPASGTEEDPIIRRTEQKLGLRDISERGGTFQSVTGP